MGLAQPAVLRVRLIKAVRARRPLFAVLDAALFLGAGLLLMCVFQRGRDADQVEANDRTTRAFVQGWTSDGTSLAGRGVTLLVADSVETGSVLDEAGETPFKGWLRWALRRSGFRRPVSYAGHFEGAVPVPEWVVETRGWAATREETVQALASQIMKLVEAHGTVDLVVQGEAVSLALEAAHAAERLAPPEARHLIRKVVVLGVRSRDIPALERFEKPGRVREWVFFWREPSPPGSDAGPGPVVRAEAFTRGFKGEVFEGEDLLFTAPPKQGWYSDKEVIVFVQRLLKSESTMEEYMMLAARKPPTVEVPVVAAPPSAQPPVPGLPAFMPFPAPVVSPAKPPDSSSLVVGGPSTPPDAKPLASSPSHGSQEGTAPSPQGGDGTTAPPAVRQPLRLIERSVDLASELARRNAERAVRARAEKRGKMAEYLAAKAAEREAAQAQDVPREAPPPPQAQAQAGPPAARTPQPPSAQPGNPPTVGGRLSGFKQDHKVKREQLKEAGFAPGGP